MSRLSRIKSTTDIYHVMTRGIDKRNIFLDKYDKINYIDDLIKTKEKFDFDLYAFCLMNNHVHLLLKDKSELSNIMKSINIRFARRNNVKYERVGHLFQNRYLSEPINDERYFLTALKYIHQNPVVGGLTGSPDKYEFSSYGDYIKHYNGEKTEYTDVFFAVNFLKSESQFIKFNNKFDKEENNFVDYKDNNTSTDENLYEYLKNNFKIDIIQTLAKNRRNDFIKEIYTDTNASIRQLSRVLGVSKKIVEISIK